MSTFGDICLALIAVLFPPLAVWIKRGICSCDSLLNLLLCCLGFLPGLLHAWYIIAKYPDDESEDGDDVDGRGAYGRLSEAEQGTVTYYYVSPQQAHVRPGGPQPSQGNSVENGVAAPGAGAGAGAGAAAQTPLLAGVSGSGAPDGGRAHREQQRGAVGYGTAGSRPAAPAASQGASDASNNGRPPPSYAEAVKGDHKTQTS